MTKNLIVFFWWFCWAGTQVSFGQHTGLKIAPEILYLDAHDAAYKNVGPGDTLFFVAGKKQYLLIKDFKGDEKNPIVMINSGGEVIFDTDHYYGISIQNCRYIKLTGTGDPTQTYGFKIKKVANGAGIGIGDLSSDYEIDHISIENCKTAGIYAKTDPNCITESVRGKFTQYNTNIHDNYIYNVGDEGLYIGSTKYYGQSILCDGNEVVLLPSLLDGVRIYNNIVKYSGWDGIQVSSASNNCRIYNNTVLFDSQDNHANQMSGIIIGGGSKCDCYNNFISQGNGNGIESHGLGGYRIYNNLILNAGHSFEPNDLSQMKHGIYVSDISVQKDSSFYIQHNDIINPKSDGIRFSSIKSKKNIIASNVIINPGNFDFYENGNTHFKGKDAYIMFQDAASEAIIQNNYLARDATNIGFISQSMLEAKDFMLVPGSPLIDAAILDKNITFDYFGLQRPFGSGPDIGAIEFGTTSLSELSKNKIQNKVFPNPINNTLIINTPDESYSDLTLIIYSLIGEVVYQNKTELVSLNYSIQADVSKLSPGIYIYVLRSKGYADSGKFEKR